MLSKKEKEEMFKDGQSSKRKEIFARMKKLSYKRIDSFDEYTQFLTSIQKIFSNRSSRKKTVTKFNKL